MMSVNIAELRSNLSTYLKRVQKGEEILVRDRKLAVARLVPASRSGDFDQDLLDLAAEGLVRLPQRKLDWKAFFSLPAPRVPLAKLKRAIEAERDED